MNTHENNIVLFIYGKFSVIIYNAVICNLHLSFRNNMS